MLQAVTSHGEPVAGVQGKEPSQGSRTQFSGIINNLVGDGKEAAAPTAAVASKRPDATRKTADASSGSVARKTADAQTAAPQDAPAAPAEAPPRDAPPMAEDPRTPDGTVKADPAPETPTSTEATTPEAAALAAILAAMGSQGTAQGQAPADVPVEVPGDIQPAAAPGDAPADRAALLAAQQTQAASAAQQTQAASAAQAALVAAAAKAGTAVAVPTTDPALTPATGDGTDSAAASGDGTDATGAATAPQVPAEPPRLFQDGIGGAQVKSPHSMTSSDMPDPGAALAGGLTPAQAKTALEQAVPGVKLQAKGAPSASDAPAAATKPALTELLHQPRPAVETPAILAQAAVAESPAATQAAQPAAHTPAATGAEAALAVAVPGAASAVRVAAPAAVPELPQAAARPSLVNQVDGSIRWLLKNQENGAELQLHPESLGTVQVKLRVDGNDVHARVWASDPAALPVLQDHRAYLEASLKEQGLNLGSFDLRQGRQGQETPLPTQPSQTAAALQGALESGQETPIAATPALLNAHRIEIVA